MSSFLYMSFCATGWCHPPLDRARALQLCTDPGASSVLHSARPSSWLSCPNTAPSCSLSAAFLSLSSSFWKTGSGLSSPGSKTFLHFLPLFSPLSTLREEALGSRVGGGELCFLHSPPLKHCLYAQFWPSSKPECPRSARFWNSEVHNQDYLCTNTRLSWGREDVSAGRLPFTSKATLPLRSVLCPWKSPPGTVSMCFPAFGLPG